MNKHIILRGCAVLAMGAAISGCSHDYDTYSPGEEATETYKRIFIETFGEPAPNHDWGFGSAAGTAVTRGITRSQSEPAVPDMDVNAAKTLAAEILAKSVELTTTNDNQNSPGYYWYENESNNGIVTNDNYVINYKISGTWSGLVTQLPTIGNHWTGQWSTDEWGNHLPETVYEPRTVYVSGKWTIPTDTYQSCGQGQGALATDGIIIVGPTGELEVNGTLNMNNQARLIVLPGGKITGSGSVQVNNGNAAGNENYNGGVITVAKFNNNFGKFYNYGEFRATQYIAGGSGEQEAGATSFFNHGLVHIKNGGVPGNYVSTNARIFNACQWYCEDDMRAYIIEEVQGASFIVGGELQMSSGNDGSSDPTYVALAAGALVQCGTLYNNGTSWIGPTDNGYAVVKVGQITYLNWSQFDYPLTAGYFENNIYMELEDGTNDPDGNGNHENDDEENYPYRASWKFEHIVANGLNSGTVGRGNGNVQLINPGTTEIIPADTDFELGEKGCTPGYYGDTTPTTEETWGDWARIIAEDLSVQQRTDFDFNDVVFDVRINSTKTKAQIKLKAAGGTLPLTVGWSGAEGTSYSEYEVHNLYGVATNIMVNTQAKNGVDGKADVIRTLTGTFNSAYDVKVMVQKRGEWTEITANMGEPASKILVKPTYNWCNERKNISDVYNGTKYRYSFDEYVKNPSIGSAWYE